VWTVFWCFGVNLLVHLEQLFVGEHLSAVRTGDGFRGVLSRHVQIHAKLLGVPPAANVARKFFLLLNFLVDLREVSVQQRLLEERSGAALYFAEINLLLGVFSLNVFPEVPFVVVK